MTPAGVEEHPSERAALCRRLAVGAGAEPQIERAALAAPFGSDLEAEAPTPAAPDLSSSETASRRAPLSVCAVLTMSARSSGYPDVANNPARSRSIVAPTIAMAAAAVLAAESQGELFAPAAAPARIPGGSPRIPGGSTSLDFTGPSREQWSPSGDGAPIGLVQQGTSGNHATSQEKPSVRVVKPPTFGRHAGFASWVRRQNRADALLAPWRHAMEAHLEGQAREIRRAHGRKAGDWYQSRADALHYPYVGRAGRCGLDRRLELHCAACGQMEERPVLCGLRHWCRKCVSERAQREYKRLVPALDARVRSERAAWIARGEPAHLAPQLRIMTLTVRHESTLEETREEISRAWPRFRRWLGHELGERFGEIGTPKGGGWGRVLDHTGLCEVRRNYWGRVLRHEPTGRKREPLRGRNKPHRRAQFCGIWEVADKSHDSGHPHLHVCVVLPWIDVRAMAAAWVRATDGKAEAQGLDLRTVPTKHAARYVAAYVTASTLDDDISPEVSAAWVRTTYARRLVQTSRGWWLPDVDRERCDCGSHEPLVPHVVRIQTVEERRAARAPPPRQPLPELRPVYLPPERRDYQLPELRTAEEQRLDFCD